MTSSHLRTNVSSVDQCDCHFCVLPALPEVDGTPLELTNHCNRPDGSRTESCYPSRRPLSRPLKLTKFNVLNEGLDQSSTAAAEHPRPAFSHDTIKVHSNTVYSVRKPQPQKIETQDDGSCNP